MRKERDLVGAVEACYRLDGTDDEWLRGFVEQVAPLVDEGGGAQAWIYDLRGGVEQVQTPVLLGIDAARVLPAIGAAHARVDRHAMAMAYGIAPLMTLTGIPVRVRGLASALREIQRHTGVADVLRVRAMDGSGRGAAFGALRDRATVVGPRRAAPLLRVAAHLQTGFRARCAARTAPPQAVLRPDGRLEHAEADARDGAARSLLRDAVIAIDRARGRMRTRNPEEALAQWRALVDGRWSLVDQWERDGRRYLVARRNEPPSRDIVGLTASETICAVYGSLGHSGKLIAYELGVAESTVSTHVRRAMRKLRLRSRVDLAKALGGPG